MLTPTDIHYLAGFMSIYSNNGEIDMKLGDMQYDNAAKKKRDIDITLLSKKTDGSIDFLTGIEVKKHSRKLNVEHIEQLCAKLKASKELTNGAIVSASGYTKHAINIAKYHKIKLYELKEWSKGSVNLGRVKLSDNSNFSFNMINITWIEQPFIKILFDVLPPDNILNSLGTFEVLNENNIHHSNYLTVKDLSLKLLDYSINELNKNKEFESLNIGDKKKYNLHINLRDDINKININDKEYQIVEVEIFGTIGKNQINLETNFKVLYDIFNNQYIGGCYITILPNKQLMGLLFSTEGVVSIISLPISKRLQSKIYNEKLIWNKDSFYFSDK